MKTKTLIILAVVILATISILQGCAASRGQRKIKPLPCSDWTMVDHPTHKTV